MVAFSGGAGTVGALGLVYEWSDVIVFIENNVIVDFTTQFVGDALPGTGTDVTIGAFTVQLANLTYQTIGGAVGVHDLTLQAGASFTQLASNFVISGALANSGLMTILANTTVTGGLVNAGVITIGAGDSNQRFVRLDDVAGAFSISGTGDIRLRDGFLTGEGGAASIATLNNSGKISGFGAIGSDFNHLSFPSTGGHLQITNLAGGKIEADVAGKVLSIQPELSAADPILNFGVLSARNGGILAISGSTVNQLGAGVIWAGTGSRVELHDAIVSGGKLDGQGSGYIIAEQNNTRLANLEITATANVNAGRSLRLEGAIVNNGKIIADTFLSTTRIDADDVILSGTGVFNLVGNYGGSSIQAEAAGAELTNSLGHTILGNGAIVGGDLSLVNEGLISARHDSYLADDIETISISGLAALHNSGVMEATAGTKLALGFMADVDNSGGIIRARGDGAVVGLNQISITGGTFATTGTGVIQADGGNVRLGDFQTLAGTNLNATSMMLGGSIVNLGAIGVTGFLTLDGTVTLSGGGTFTLFDNYRGTNVVGRVAGTVLNNIDSTIKGDGAIGIGVGIFNDAGKLSVINSGTIAADFDPYNGSSGLALVALAALTNSGLLEARNGATLTLGSPGSGVIQNTGGTIRATGAGSVVALSGSSLTGGRLDATNGGHITLSNMTLDGSVSALSTNADLTVDSSRLTLKGAIANSGNVLISSSGSLFFGGDTVLTGAGSFTITPPYHFSVVSLSGAAGATLTNFGNTFGGAGSFGANSGMVLINGAGGVITANQVGGGLAVQTGSVVTNRGVLMADGGILDVQDNVTGNGRLELRNGGTLIVDQGTDQRVVFAGSSADTLALARREAAAGGFDFPISGMQAGDRIRLDVGAGQGQEAAFTFLHTAEGGVLSATVFSDGLGVAYNLRLVGPHSVGQFKLVGGADGFFSFLRLATQDGGAGADSLTAAAGGERVIGLDGNDTLISGAGNDVLDGALGLDTADFRLASSGVTVSLGLTGAQAIGGTLGIDTLLSIENLTGSDFSDSLTGNDLANVLVGGIGKDTLNGGLGNDVMLGGTGNDTYVVDSLGDRVVETKTLASLADAGGTDTVFSSVSFDLGATVGASFVERLTLTGIDAISATGNGLANILTGNGGNNLLDGAGGKDTMIGGAGNDTYVVGSAGDRVYETTTPTSAADAGGLDEVRASVSFDLAANAGVGFVERLTLTGSAPVAGLGNALANLLVGNSGNNTLAGLGDADTLTGNDGDDTLNGGARADQLTGGAGLDSFVFDAALGGINADVITDYSVADDVIRLDDAIFTGLALGAVTSAFFEANTTGRASGPGVHIVYQTNTGSLFWDDGAGGSPARQFAQVAANLVGFTENEFIVF